MTALPPVDPRPERLLGALGASLAARIARAPGRVNLIGDHTDYQDGWCLPAAIDRDALVAFAPRTDRFVHARSLDLAGAVQIAADGSTEPATVEPAWGRTVAAVVRVLAARGRPAVGFDAVVASNVPLGSGLSSSAAVEVALALAAGHAARASLSGRELALAAQEAEHLATGVPCGVMDQMTAVFGRSGHALLLDCRTLAVEPVPIPPTIALVVVHSGLPRKLEASAYAQRRAACEAAATRVGVPALRDATAAQVAGDPIARHVVSENERVLAFAEALRRADPDTCGRLMVESHRSLRDDFRVSTPELDLLVDLALDAGAHGARLTGAGFGGCVVALVPAEGAERVAGAVAARYGAHTGLTPQAFGVQATSGAGLVPAGPPTGPRRE